MRDGHLHQFAPPEVVDEHPTDLVVADFLGSPPMNCLPARCQVSDGVLELRSGALGRLRPGLAGPEPGWAPVRAASRGSLGGTA